MEHQFSKLGDPGFTNPSELWRRPGLGNQQSLRRTRATPPLTRRIGRRELARGLSAELCEFSSCHRCAIGVKHLVKLLACIFRGVA